MIAEERTKSDMDFIRKVENDFFCFGFTELEQSPNYPPECPNGYENCDDPLLELTCYETLYKYFARNIYDLFVPIVLSFGCCIFSAGMSIYMFCHQKKSLSVNDWGEY